MPVPESREPWPERTPARSARRRSRSASSCRAARRPPRDPGWPLVSSEPASCRTSGNRRDGPAALRGASGRCKAVWSLRARPLRGFVPMPSRTLGSHPVVRTRRQGTSGKGMAPTSAPAGDRLAHAREQADRGFRGPLRRASRSMVRIGTVADNGRCKSKRSHRRARCAGSSLRPPSCGKWDLCSSLSPFAPHRVLTAQNQSRTPNTTATSSVRSEMSAVSPNRRCHWMPTYGATSRRIS